MRDKRTGKPQIPLKGHVLFRKRDHVFHIGERVNGFTNPALFFHAGEHQWSYISIYGIFIISESRDTQNFNGTFNSDATTGRLLHRLLQRDLGLHYTG